MPATWNPTPITVMANQRQKNIEIEMNPGVYSEIYSVNGSSDRHVLQRFFADKALVLRDVHAET